MSNSFAIFPYDIKKYFYYTSLQEESDPAKKMDLSFKIKLIDKISYNIIKEFAQERWNSLRNLSPLDFDTSFFQPGALMRNLMDRVETREDSQFNKESIYQTNPQGLFKALKIIFCKSGVEVPNPLLFSTDEDIIKLLEKKQSINDEALVAIWPQINNKLLNRKTLSNADEIRSYISELSGQGQLASIEKISFEMNNLKTIPTEIDSRFCLRSLYIRSKNIKFVPDIMMYSLKELSFRISEVDGIDSFTIMTNLVCLNLEYNNISVIPNSISKLSFLEKLCLNQNKIYNIRPLSELTNLQELELNYNRIVNIYPVCELAYLKILKLNQNLIKVIPDLSHLKNIEIIFLDNNKISTIPESVSILFENLNVKIHIANNLITKVPESLLEMENRQALFLDGNPLLFIHDKYFEYYHGICLEKYEKCRLYPPSSKFSQLCKLMIFESDNLEAIKEIYSGLKINDRRLIFRKVVSLMFEGENHQTKIYIFNDMNIFYRAVRKVIHEKFEGLSIEKRKKAFDAANDLMNKNNVQAQHAFENVLLLLDAIDKAEEEEDDESLSSCVIA